MTTIETLFRASDLFKPNDERKALILGSGTSLEGFDFSKLADPDLYVFAINDEMYRNRDEYTPDAWIFFDLVVMRRYRDATVPEDTKIFTTKPNVVNAIKEADGTEKTVPQWIHRIHTFDSCRTWDMNSDMLLMCRTTASAALCLAAKMGFKTIGLAGTDFYTREDKYYYATDQGPRIVKKRAKNFIDDDIYMEPRHVKMVHDMTKVKEGMERFGWVGDVIQTSMRSPLDCYPKMPMDEFLAL